MRVLSFEQSVPYTSSLATMKAIVRENSIDYIMQGCNPDHHDALLKTELLQEQASMAVYTNKEVRLLAAHLLKQALDLTITTRCWGGFKLSRGSRESCGR